jgi:hypothetical protein
VEHPVHGLKRYNFSITPSSLLPWRRRHNLWNEICLIQTRLTLKRPLCSRFREDRRRIRINRPGKRRECPGGCLARSGVFRAAERKVGRNMGFSARTGGRPRASARLGDSDDKFMFADPFEMVKAAVDFPITHGVVDTGKSVRSTSRHSDWDSRRINIELKNSWK